MIEDSYCPCLLLEETSSVIAATIRRIEDSLGANDFDSYLPVDTRIFCEIDITHTPASDDL